MLKEVPMLLALLFTMLLIPWIRPSKQKNTKSHFGENQFLVVLSLPIAAHFLLWKIQSWEKDVE